jgi:hypothetical protein
LWSLAQNELEQEDMKLQKFKIIKVPTLGCPLGSPIRKCHLDVASMKKHKVYYREESDGLFSNLGCVNVMSPKQICDPKLILFHLITCII